MHSPESEILPRAISPAVSSRKWWRWPWDLIAVAGGLSYLGVVGLLFTAASLPLLLVLPRDTARKLGRGLVHRAFRAFVGYLRVTDLVQADLSSLDVLQHDHRPVIIAPNHTSLWDAVFVISKLPQPICIMKAAVLKNPFLGGGARLAGYIPNGCCSRMVRDAAQALKDGGQLLLFPEGTRTRRDARWINPLGGGCALIARKAGVPVLPVFIRSSSRFLEKGWPLWKKPDFPIRISIELGDEVLPGEHESSHDFTRRLETIYRENLSRAHKLRRHAEPD